MTLKTYKQAHVSLAYLGFQQFAEIGGQVEEDPLLRARQSDSSDQQHEQHDVGEGGCR